MKGSQFVVILVIILVVTIPINSSFALAQISSVRYEGSSEVEGIVRGYDSVTIEAEFDSHPDEAKLNFYGLRDFDECSDAVCSYTSETRQISHGDTFEVFEYSEGLVADSKEVSLRVDDEPPQVTELEIERQEDLYIFLIGMRDYPDFCSGIGSVNILVGSDIQETFDVEESFCSMEREYELSLDDLSLDRGYNEICVQLYDKVGISSDEKCESVFFDDRKPELNDFQLLDIDGNKIEYVSEHSSIEAQVKVNVTDLQLKEVVGNFSDFHTQNDYYDMVAQCEKAGEEDYTCTWDGLELRSETGELNYEVMAKDEQGNTANVKSSFSLTYDDSPPEVEKIYTKPIIGESDYLYVTLGKNKIYVDFSDSASGFSNGKVYADIHVGGSFNNNKKADNCINKGNRWQCYWEIDVSSDTQGQGDIKLRQNTEDDAGNFLGQDIEKTIKIDSEEPVVKEANPPDDICPYAGSGMDIELLIESESPIKVNTTASEITRTSKKFEADCETKEDNLYECNLHIDELVRTHTEDSIDINVLDAAGNIHVKELDVEVCEAIEGESPDLVEVDYNTYATIDRRTLSFVSLPVAVNLDLRPTRGSEVVNMDANCQSPVESSHITNEDSLSPLLIARVGEAAAGNGEGPVEFNCTLSLLVKQGGKFYTDPQVEELNIKLDATPGFGEMGEAVEEKIENLEDDIEGIEDDIESWENWNQWLSMICSLAEMLASMNSVMALIRSVFYGVGVAMTNTCPGAYSACTATGGTAGAAVAVCKAGWIIYERVCQVTSKYHEYITKWVWNPSWTSGYFSGTGQWIKWLCFIYSCKLCTWDYADSIADMTGVDSKIVRAVSGPISSYYGAKPSEIAGNIFGESFGEAISIENIAGSVGIESYQYVEYAATGVFSGAKYWASTLEEPSRIKLILDGGVMDPYKSIHAARACLCIPGIIYNLKKDKQIKCMYRNCLQERAEAGLPTDFCDKVYRERQCLYVDGAQWKAIGSNAVFDFFQNLVGLIVRNLDAIKLSEGWASSCGHYIDAPMSTKCPIPTAIGGCGTPRTLSGTNTGFDAVSCHLQGAAAQLMQVGSFMNVDFDKYDAGLEGDTVC